MSVTDSDAFLDMPLTSQLLYFHLGMRADDEGFIGNPKRIIRMLGAGEDDIKILSAKKLVIVFESGVVVIRHWRIHNTIRMDRFSPTVYRKEKDQLYLEENRSYTTSQDGTRLATKRQPMGHHGVPQVKSSKENLNIEPLNPEAEARLEKIKGEIRLMVSSKQVRDLPLDNSILPKGGPAEASDEARAA